MGRLRGVFLLWMDCGLLWVSEVLMLWEVKSSCVASVGPLSSDMS